MADITGLKALKKALKKATDLDGVKRVVQQNGAELNKRMEKEAELASQNNSSRKDMIGDINANITNGGMTVEVGSTADYAEYIEFGTRFMEARPYAAPALKEQKMQFKKDMNKLVR